ncbi:polymorphic toxin-type HINT domain-containing protein [Kitasatospora sp. NPDC058201]|uniref:polymorphic toxin-type HINT domain-containing protein n=1 Tax=unclassified Kitasatospora TaxID=2633591 RepID=UPI003652D9D1
MGDGSRKPIEAVNVGDTVLATNPNTGEIAAKAVEREIYTPDDRNFTSLSIMGDSGSGSLVTTDHHPFWSENQHAWVDAVDLEVGDQLSTSTGSTAKINGIQRLTRAQGAYNLTVRDLHTYYVFAGETAVLVHNETCLDTVVEGSKRTIPEWAGRETAGFARGDKGAEKGYDLVSGNGKDDASLIDLVNEKLKDGGLTLGASKSTRSGDVEQKFVAIMHR